MDLKSKRESNRHYSKLLKEHGKSIRALNYKVPRQQLYRFSLLADLGPISPDSSFLDVGCGLGHFCDFLRSHGWTGKYTGIDINPDMIGAAKVDHHANDRFLCCDILSEDFEECFDYVVCGATIQRKPKYSDPKRYYQRMIKKMFSLTRKALAFDIFSNRVNFRRDINLYADPFELLEYCYSFTTRVVLRNDYRPYEIMVYMYKETSIDKLNCYEHFSAGAPRIGYSCDV